MENVNVRIWYGSDDSYNRYAGVRLSTSGISAEISEGLARELVAAVRDDRPVLAARIEEVCDEVGRRTSVSHEDLGDDVYDWLDDSSATARAYELLGLQPPSQE